jgi:excisionase family DNA binding protein
MANLGGSNKLLTTREAADLLNIRYRALLENWRSWGLQPYKIGVELRFRERDIWAWLETKQEPCPSPAIVPRRREIGKSAKDRAARETPWTCPCGRTVRGNGGKASHRRGCPTYQGMRSDLA